MNKKLIVSMLIGLAILAGCQTAVEKKAENKSYGNPYSVGPANPPESTKGPTSAPPQNTTTTVKNQAQAVTTNENIRLTLPRKTE